MSPEPQPLRILVVDDDADHRMLLRRQFVKAGHDDVLEAPDGEAAVRMAVAARPDLIVLDLAMPIRSGMEVLPELHELLPGSRIVVLSSFPRRRMVDAVRQRGAVGYVEKRAPAGRLARDVLVAAELVDGVATVASTRLDPERTAARAARRFVRDALEAEEEVLANVELLVSELVTNAVIHAAGAPQLDVHVTLAAVRVEVYDDDPRLPERRVPDQEGPGGRGLLLLDRLASRWDAEHHLGGKVVWFEIDRLPS